MAVHVVMIEGEKAEVDNMGLLQGLLTLISLLKQAREIESDFQSGIQWMRESNGIALVRVMARNAIFPTIIERVDDGTNPEQQYLRIDMALTFPQERINKALYYRASQSVTNLVEQALTAVFAQALRDTQPGDERMITVTIDYMDNAAIYTYVIHGQVGREWSYVGHPSKRLHIRQMWRKAREIQTQYLEQTEQKSRAKQRK